MTFKTSLVDIDKITSPIKRSHFSEADLEKLAQLILQLNGIVQPLVVKEVSLEKYEVIEGDFQFYGALKAWEIDDDFEMIRAFIVNEQENKLVEQQINLLGQLNSDNNSSNQLENKVEIISNSNLEIRVDNLENRLHRLAEISETNLDKQVKALEWQIKKINEQMPSKLDLLKSFNELEAEKLIYPLQSAGINSKEVDKIITCIVDQRKKKPFNSLVDLMERSKVSQGKKKVRLITEAKLIKIMDCWAKTAFSL